MNVREAATGVTHPNLQGTYRNDPVHITYFRGVTHPNLQGTYRGLAIVRIEGKGL